MHRKLIRHLNNLESPDIIAEFLTKMGVTGAVNDGETCVISNWLMTSTDNYDITTTPDEIIVCSDYYAQKDVEVFPLESTVTEFIKAFDEGKYPQLISDNFDDFGYDGT